jgi:hypothetical protein
VGLRRQPAPHRVFFMRLPWRAWPGAGALSDRDGFGIAWAFLVIANALGLLLRVQTLVALPAANYGYILHAHSHVAFLGWVYNAFFVLALALLVRPEDRMAFRRLFVLTQVATLGMLFTFPFQGYARESIAFSTAHVAGQAVFAWMLLRRNRATPAAQLALRWAFAFMLLSAAGPIALGPMAAADMRGSPWYSLAIYYYLHFQYNGWFVFFLLALLLLVPPGPQGGDTEAAARRAVHWLAAGCLLTLTLSALWVNPPGWVANVGIVGAAAQLVGGAYLIGALRARPPPFRGAAAIWLARIAAAGFVIKLLLQFIAGWPGIVELASLRMVIIGFLHLVFLGVVTPLVISWAETLGWLRIHAVATAGLATLLGGALLNEAVLFWQAVPMVLPAAPLWPRAFEWLAAGAALMLLGTVLLAFGFRGARAARGNASRVATA